jgi:hypothetical protein
MGAVVDRDAPEVIEGNIRRMTTSVAVEGWRRRFGSSAFASAFALLCLWPLGCGSTPNTPSPVDGSGAVDRPAPKDGSPRTDGALDASGSQCKFPSVVGTCVPARAFVTCTEQNGSSSYQSADPLGCLNCSGTCQDSCTLGEFSLSCGAPQSDAAATPGDPMYGCRVALVFPSGSVTYCCPCP